MAMRLATEEELMRWDELVAANPDGGNALQTKAWGDFKARLGCPPARCVYDTSSGLVAAQSLVPRATGQGEPACRLDQAGVELGESGECIKGIHQGLVLKRLQLQQ